MSVWHFAAGFGCDRKPMYVGYGSATDVADVSSFVIARDGVLRSFYASVSVNDCAGWTEPESVIDGLLSSAVPVPDLRRIVFGYARFELRFTILRLPDSNLFSIAAVGIGTVIQTTATAAADLDVAVFAGDRLALQVESTEACNCNVSCGLVFD
jgi:hypothetical protein